jgi:Fur family iron response transcriptional regulator
MEGTMVALRREIDGAALATAETNAPPPLSVDAGDEDLSNHPCADLLRRAGLRLTRQRLTLGWLLFSKGGRHVSAEMLHDEAKASDVYISLATVYNTLHQLTDAGLLRQIGVDGTKSFFDTSPGTHHHFFFDGEDRLLDIPESVALFDSPPEPLPGYVVSRVDVIVHLRKKVVHAAEA